MKTFNLITLFIVAVMPVVQARANDGKNYNSSNCVPTVQVSGNYTQGGNIVNYSPSQYLYVDCPVTKEIIHGKIQNAWVEIKSSHPYAQAGCTLHNRSNREQGKNNMLLKWVYGSHSPQWQKLHYSGMNSSPDSYYYFSCVLPPSYNGVPSTLGAYSVTEI